MSAKPLGGAVKHLSLRLDDVVTYKGQTGYVTQVGGDEGFEIEEGVTEILPDLTVRVEWISGENAILGVQDLNLLDRPLLVGDTVCRMEKITERGTVIQSECRADLNYLQSGDTVQVRLSHPLSARPNTL